MPVVARYATHRVGVEIGLQSVCLVIDSQSNRTKCLDHRIAFANVAGIDIGQAADTEPSAVLDT